MIYQRIIRPLFFMLPAEQAHYLATSLIKLAFFIPGMRQLVKRQYQFHSGNLETELFGIRFPNPVGLAAGFDKGAGLIHAMDAFGFGFIEIGTITPKGQPGNPKPRLFRLPKDRSLINRLGFNNDGLDKTVKRLKKVHPGIIVGGNIGKNKITPNESATNDYLNCFETLYPYVDYFVVNVSSPNTPGLRELQEKEPLTQLLQSLQERNNQQEKPKPILLKIAPDLNSTQIDDIIEIVMSLKIDGIIATNTTISRADLNTDERTITGIGNGGLSGKALEQRSNAIIHHISQKTGGQLPIIGVGGVFTGEDALAKLRAGASLVQVYTGFVYEGPGMVKRINKYLSKHLQPAGIRGK
jgi:dihydroorotate dehydrogenase